jgi:hypothetical protein
MNAFQARMESLGYALAFLPDNRWGCTVCAFIDPTNPNHCGLRARAPTLPTEDRTCRCTRLSVAPDGPKRRFYWVENPAPSYPED